MVEKEIILTRGGIYLAKLNPAKTSEPGKIRPVILLNSEDILDSVPPVVFICPLSSKSESNFSNIHLKLLPRDNLEVTSFALIEHCRSVSLTRIIHPRIAQVTKCELSSVFSRLKLILDI
ncbi:MAG: MazF family transcriptional regulator [Rickettsiales bacterium]|nr:MAG: MazF family transcriptional regulator [Rickettsiales bacterium]